MHAYTSWEPDSWQLGSRGLCFASCKSAWQVQPGSASTHLLLEAWQQRLHCLQAAHGQGVWVAVLGDAAAAFGRLQQQRAAQQVVRPSHGIHPHRDTARGSPHTGLPWLWALSCRYRLPQAARSREMTATPSSSRQAGYRQANTGRVADKAAPPPSGNAPPAGLQRPAPGLRRHEPCLHQGG